MVTVREPLLKPVAIADLRPTQITVGMREVAARRKRWRALEEKEDGVSGHAHDPTILGPKDRHYVIDHHHLVLALHKEGVEEVPVIVLANLRKLDQDAFWTVMDNRSWMHPFDTKGRRRPYRDIPRTISELVDDPFRSLAGELRRLGGYSKETTPFSEFLWADFLRRRMREKQLASDFPRALNEAYRLAKSRDADYLPGWCGPSKED